MRGDVPPALKDVSLLTLDIGLLQAGASMKGEFENRLRQVIEEVQASPKPIILFVDEAHTLIGAGGAQGTGDAANLLKPALARGTLRTIAATTWAEYKKYIEKDPALTRRFQVVQVAEPSEHNAILMVRGIASVLEKHHRVQVLDEAIEAAVRLSHRYIPARQLPDKAVSLLDTASARVAVSQHAVPAELEDCLRRIESLQIELDIIGREDAVGIDVKRPARVPQPSYGTRANSVESSSRSAGRRNASSSIAFWRFARSCERGASRSRELGASSNRPRRPSEPPSQSATRSQPRNARRCSPSSTTCTSHSTEVQGDSPLILPSVDEHAVASVVQDWTGVPVGRMVRNELEAVINLTDTLNQRVIGQRHALEMIARRIQTSRARLDNPNKPIGVFMLCGPSGVGKTETALALAEALYGGEQNVITINMSEFQEAHTVSDVERGAARIRRLRRGWRADRGGPAPSLQRRPARRDREGAFRRARAVLPGLRQGLDGGRRGASHRLQEHHHPADV